MADSKVKKLDLDQMEKITGGSMAETYGDAMMLRKLGYFTDDDIKAGNYTQTVTAKLNELGYEGQYEPNDLAFTSNVYRDDDGNKITREQFWKDFMDVN